MLCLCMCLICMLHCGFCEVQAAWHVKNVEKQCLCKLSVQAAWSQVLVLAPSNVKLYLSEMVPVVGSWLLPLSLNCCGLLLQPHAHEEKGRKPTCHPPHPPKNKKCCMSMNVLCLSVAFCILQTQAMERGLLPDCLVGCTDQEGCNMTTDAFAKHELQLVTFWSWDGVHRTTNDNWAAIEESGNSGPIVRSTLWLNLRYGPWQKGANFRIHNKRHTHTRHLVQNRENQKQEIARTDGHANDSFTITCQESSLHLCKLAAPCTV